jgi:hypothetical protein
MSFSFPKGTFTNDLTVAIEQAIDGMKPQVGHTQVIGIRVDKGNGELTPPILDDSALLPGDSPSGFFDLIPTHRVFYLPRRFEPSISYSPLSTM